MRFARALSRAVAPSCCNSRLIGPAATASSSSCSTTSRTSASTRLMSSSHRMSGADMLEAFPRPTQGTDVAGAMYALANANAVCFDVDSTVITEEGIDVLAEHMGQGEAVAKLTAQAMQGGMKFQDALAARLYMLKPSQAVIQECLAQRPFELTPGVAELVEKLHEQSTHVYLVSGGFRIMIEPIAERLQIPTFNIIANHILFDHETGQYAGFDTNEPTSQDMGKPRAVQSIIDMHNYGTVVMVGDGATDAQAKPPATAFVGFGGVAVREKVQATADWFVTDFEDMIHVVNYYGP